MRYVIFFWLLLIGFAGYAQTAADHQVTLAGIGPFKVNMKKTDIEKLLNQKLKTNSNKIDNYGYDTIPVNYKGANLTLVLYKKFISEGKSETALYSVSGSSPLLKTKSGIVVGDDKMKVIATYNDYNMNIYSDYEPDDKGDYKKSKTKSTIVLFDENTAGVIYFKMVDKKVVSFTAAMYEGE